MQTLNACASPRPLPNETDFRYQSNPSVLPVPHLFPRAQEFPWLFLAGTQQLHFNAETLGANLTITKLKFHPHPVPRGLILVLLQLCSFCEGVGDRIIKILIL